MSDSWWAVLLIVAVVVTFIVSHRLGYTFERRRIEVRRRAGLPLGTCSTCGQAVER